MESKNYIVPCVQIFALVSTALLFWVGKSYVAEVGGPFVAAIFLIIAAPIFAVAAAFRQAEKNAPEHR